MTKIVGRLVFPESKKAQDAEEQHIPIKSVLDVVNVDDKTAHKILTDYRNALRAKNEAAVKQKEIVAKVIKPEIERYNEAWKHLKELFMADVRLVGQKVNSFGDGLLTYDHITGKVQVKNTYLSALFATKAKKDYKKVVKDYGDHCKKNFTVCNTLAISSDDGVTLKVHIKVADLINKIKEEYQKNIK
jgi:hypothetical protein